MALLLLIPFALSAPQPIDSRAGFAIWPVDTPAEARRECLAAEPWRRSPEKTVERFAAEMLNTTRVSVSVRGDDFSVAGQSIPLEHYGGLREAFGCWYVTGILNREGFPEAGFGYAGAGDDRVLFAHLRWLIKNGTPVSLGSGQEHLVVRDLRAYHDEGQTLITMPASATEPGHYFIGNSGGDGVVDDPDSGIIAAPPEPDELIEIPGAQQIRRSIASEERCPRFGRTKDPLKTIRRDISNALFSTDGKREGATRALGRNRYSARVGQARATWSFWELSRTCTIKGTITTEGPDRIEGVSASREGFAFDFAWRGADSVELSFGFGEVGQFTTAGRLKGPITYPIESVRSERYGDGYLFAVFFKDGEVVGLEGGALPRVEWLETSLD